MPSRKRQHRLPPIPPRPNQQHPQRRSPRPPRARTRSHVVPDGGRAVSVAANSSKISAKMKTARRNRAVFYLPDGSAGRKRRLDIRWFNVLPQVGTKLLAIEFAFPPGYHHAGDAVAAQVGKGAAF